MILAAGLTPAWQQILLFDSFAPGEVNRAREARWCASGKVLNVGIALHHLGAECRTVSVIGGRTGEAIRRDFENSGSASRWVESGSPTRVCTTILDASRRVTTELVENSGALRPDELKAFRDAFEEEAETASVIVLSGSLPVGTPATLYRDLIARTPARVILDARGPELVAALEHRPFLVKPNREELARTAGRPLAGERDLFSAMHDLNARGAEWVVVTGGYEAVLATSEGAEYRWRSLQAPVVNPIGCGDCLAAGVAWALDGGADVVATIGLGIAAATENLSQLLPARLNPQRVRELARSIAPERLR